jgi:energy-coupling factor transport system ATP-binding protein
MTTGAIELLDFSYRYPASDERALSDVSVSIAPGEFVLVCGDSGSGKSTFLRAVLGLVPHHFGGEVWGAATICGQDLRHTSAGRLAAVCGSLFQDPESQSVMDSVRAEIAFPLENLGQSTEQIALVVAKTARQLGIEHLLDRRTDELSGGELQRVVLAAALAPGPSVLVLDEPSTQIDPRATEELLRTLSDLSRERGTTVLIADHHIERTLNHATRALHFDQGRLTHDEEPTGFLKFLWRNPPASSSFPRGTHRLPRDFSEEAGVGEAVLTVEGVRYRYPRGGEDVLGGVDLTLVAGERAVLVGDNGAGKSTLLQVAKGLREPTGGQVHATGEVALLLQNPNDYLIHERVTDEAPLESLARFGVADLADRDPRDLSGGQRQRVALAIVMQVRPAVLLLDEPSRGMGQKDKLALADLIRSISDEGTAVLVATHDLEFAELFATRRIVIENGRVAADAPLTAERLEAVHA